MKLSKINYYAIRKRLDDEITKDASNDEARRKQHIVGTMLEILVGHPENYTKEDADAILSGVQLMTPSIMKKPERRQSVPGV